jgi:hypothetical protein
MGGPQQPVRLSAEYPKVSSASADLLQGNTVTNVPHRSRAPLVWDIVNFA